VERVRSGRARRRVWMISSSVERPPASPSTLRAHAAASDSSANPASRMAARWSRRSPPIFDLRFWKCLCAMCASWHGPRPKTLPLASQVALSRRHPKRRMTPAAHWADEFGHRPPRADELYRQALHLRRKNPVLRICRGMSTRTVIRRVTRASGRQNSPELVATRMRSFASSLSPRTAATFLAVMTTQGLENYLVTPDTDSMNKAALSAAHAVTGKLAY